MGFQMKKGPCGGKGFPSCQEELMRMAEKKGANKSYLKSIKLSDVGNMKQMTQPQFGGSTYMSPKHVDKAINAETQRRATKIINHPYYEALTQNKEARPIINSVDKFLKKSRERKNRSEEYLIPSIEEAGTLLEIGGKYVDSKDLASDITAKDKFKAILQGGKLLFKYPNLGKIANKYK